MFDLRFCHYKTVYCLHLKHIFTHLNNSGSITKNTKSWLGNLTPISYLNSQWSKLQLRPFADCAIVPEHIAFFVDNDKSIMGVHSHCLSTTHARFANRFPFGHVSEYLSENSFHTTVPTSHFFITHILLYLDSCCKERRLLQLLARRFNLESEGKHIKKLTSVVK